MKLSQGDKDWLSGEIERQVNELLEVLSPHGWRKAVFWIQKIGPIVAIVSVIVSVFIALVVLAVNQFNLANTRLAKEAVFETNTTRDIGDIQKSITAIQGELAKMSLINHSSLPLSEFKTTLPELGAAVAVAKQHQVKISPTVVGDLQQKMIASRDAPDFWPTAAAFISYRSQAAIADAQSLLLPNLPNCTDHEPEGMKVITSSETQFTAEPARYDNCIFTLDSAQDDEKLNAILENLAPKIKFRHCLIVYRGGAMNLIIAFRDRPSKVSMVGDGKKTPPTAVINVSGSTIYFENCLFSLVMSNTPPPNGQDFANKLLASNGTTVEFPVQKEPVRQP